MLKQLYQYCNVSFIVQPLLLHRDQAGVKLCVIVVQDSAHNSKFTVVGFNTNTEQKTKWVDIIIKEFKSEYR